jgi:hypothetical protein
MMQLQTTSTYDEGGLAFNVDTIGSLSLIVKTMSIQEIDVQ